MNEIKNIKIIKDSDQLIIRIKHKSDVICISDFLTMLNIDRNIDGTEVKEFFDQAIIVVPISSYHKRSDYIGELVDMIVTHIERLNARNEEVIQYGNRVSIREPDGTISNPDYWYITDTSDNPKLQKYGKYLVSFYNSKREICLKATDFMRKHIEKDKYVVSISKESEIVRISIWEE